MSSHQVSLFVFGSLFLLGSLAACGSKTGLVAPEPIADAGVDAEVPFDAAPPSPPPPPPPCVEAPTDLGPVRVELDIPAQLAVIDLVFLIDSTGSMQDEIDAVRRGLREVVVPGVRAAIPDAAFGLALFGEFPIRPHGPPGVEAYELRAQVTLDVPRVEAALDDTPVWGNFDHPEAAIEGLFQVVTGAGYGSPGDPGHIPPATGCPGGGQGGVCFRPDALPVIMLITDAPMNNGPPRVAPVNHYRFRPPPASYEEAVEATRRLGAIVIGLGSEDFGAPSPHAHLRALARDVGSLDSRGEPLHFDIGRRGDRIGEDVVRAVQLLAEDVPLDIEAFVEDVPGDGVDANEVLRGIRALRAEPPEGAMGLEGASFFGVRPGTRLIFELEVDASELEPSPERRVFPARVLFRASGRSRLELRRLDIVVPGEDGIGCPPDEA